MNYTQWEYNSFSSSELGNKLWMWYHKMSTYCARNCLTLTTTPSLFYFSTPKWYLKIFSTATLSYSTNNSNSIKFFVCRWENLLLPSQIAILGLITIYLLSYGRGKLKLQNASNLKFSHLLFPWERLPPPDTNMLKISTHNIWKQCSSKKIPNKTINMINFCGWRDMKFNKVRPFCLKGKFFFTN